MTQDSNSNPRVDSGAFTSTTLSRRGLLKSAIAVAGMNGPALEAARAQQSSRILYENPLASEADVRGFRIEGQASITFPEGRMRLQNKLDPSLGQKANFVYWCPENFPDGIAINWEFRPIYEPGLCIVFFAARGVGGQDLFDPSLAVRTGMYGQYNNGDINALHASYFRRIGAVDRSFHLCNLRKSKGFHLVAQGADPIPSVPDVTEPYRMRIEKQGPRVSFLINELPIFQWTDDGTSYGPVLKNSGKVGFRQMAPTVGEYANLRVERLRA